MKIFKLTIFFLVFSNTIFTSFGQKKVKYKDLYPLLQSKEYKTAFPLLKIYLENNDDEANPHFFMGEILRISLDTIPIFEELETFDSVANKAISHFKTAIQLVDEREIRKNDEYYIAYNRRDLRTGKFGIKVSDVHLDYEDRINSISNKAALSSKLVEQRNELINAYGRIQQRVNELVKEYATEEELLFSMTDFVQADLEELITQYNDFQTSFKNNYQELQNFESELYDGEFELVEVNSWIQLYEVDIRWNNPKLKRIGPFFSKILLRYQEEIKPLKNKLNQATREAFSILKATALAEDTSKVEQIRIPDEFKNLIPLYDRDTIPLKMQRYLILKNKSMMYENPQLYTIAEDQGYYKNKRYYKELLSIYNEMAYKLEELNNIRLSEYKGFYDRYFKLFDPNFASYIEMEKSIMSKKASGAKQLYNRYDSLTSFFIYQNDTISVQDSAQNILFKENIDSTLQVVTVSQGNTFFFVLDDIMQIEKKLSYDSIYSDAKIINKENHLMLSLIKTDTVSINSVSGSDSLKTLEVIGDTLVNKVKHNMKVLYFTKPDYDLIWELAIPNRLSIVDFKRQAGIIFIYNEKEEVVLTLTKDGKVIE